MTDLLKSRTGRNTSPKPNIQNIQMRSETRRTLRDAFLDREVVELSCDDIGAREYYEERGK